MTMWIAGLVVISFYVAVILQIVGASEGTLNVIGKVVLPDGNPIAGSPVSLNSGEYTVTSRIDGSFTFYDVFSGIYSLDVYSTAFHFPQLKLKVSTENATVSVVEYKYPGAARISAPYPIIISAIAPIQYEIPKPPFSLLGMLMGNPMILMMIFMGGMAFIMPKMMANMTPEELEELKKQSAAGGDPMAKLNKLMGVSGPPDDDDDN